MIDPVTVVVALNTTKQAAFSAFVRNINDWWPVEHFSVAKGLVSIEPRQDGKIIEVAADGATHQWGHVTAWDEPNRLAISWYVGNDAIATAIEISFATTDDGRTGVTLVHSGWDALGADGVTKRDNYKMGWAQIFGQRFAEFAEESCAAPQQGKQNA